MPSRPGSKSKVIAARATPELAALFQKACDQLGVDAATAIRTMLEDFLVRSGYELPPSPAKAALRRALARRPNPLPLPSWAGEIHAVLSAPPAKTDGLTYAEREKAKEAGLDGPARKRFATARAGRKQR